MFTIVGYDLTWLTDAAQTILNIKMFQWLTNCDGHFKRLFEAAWGLMEAPLMRVG